MSSTTLKESKKYVLHGGKVTVGFLSIIMVSFVYYKHTYNYLFFWLRRCHLGQKFKIIIISSLINIYGPKTPHNFNKYKNNEQNENTINRVTFDEQSIHTIYLDLERYIRVRLTSIPL